MSVLSYNDKLCHYASWQCILVFALQRILEDEFLNINEKY